MAHRLFNADAYAPAAHPHQLVCPATQAGAPVTTPAATAIQPAQVLLPTVTPDVVVGTQALPTATPMADLPSPTATAVAAAEPLPFPITLPLGFQIAYYAQNVPNARSLALSPNGTLFVGSRSAGNVYAVVDQNGAQQVDNVMVVASGLNSPNGVAFQDGALYVAEIQRILRFDDIEANLTNPPAPVVINQDYPSENPTAPTV